MNQRHSVTLQSSDLTVVIGDNAPDGAHRAGYNGIWKLTHRAHSDNFFVPFFAGFNLEHLFTPETTREDENFFEPRHAPMHLNLLADGTAVLHQPPTPITQVESWTSFRLVDPDVIEFSFRCVPGRKAHEYVGAFWASYIHAPQDKSMYFRGGLAAHSAQTTWQQLCTQLHAHDATVCRRGNTKKLLYHPEMRETLFHSLSPLCWDEPFFYGRRGDMTLLASFEDNARFRLTHSPSGGGLAAESQTTNPAWDFQYIIENPKVGEEYALRGRIICRHAMSREDVLREAVIERSNPAIAKRDREIQNQPF